MNKLLGSYNDVWSVNKYEIIIKAAKFKGNVLVKYICTEYGHYHDLAVDEKKRFFDTDKFVQCSFPSGNSGPVGEWAAVSGVCVKGKADSYMVNVFACDDCAGKHVCVSQCFVVWNEQRYVSGGCFNAIWYKRFVAFGIRYVPALLDLCAGGDSDNVADKREENRKQQIFWSVVCDYCGCHNRLYFGMLCKSCSG